MKGMAAISDRMVSDLRHLRFGAPVTHVYNPMAYARDSYDLYVARYGGVPKEIILVGMNPGPWGMAQTGVPFGEVCSVREWMGIEARVGTPDRIHPKRPVLGFECQKSEVSGRRLWGWARQRFGTAGYFFSRFFVVNYCPLLFIESGGKNRTPDKLIKGERQPLFQICDRALRSTVEHFKPRYVIGIGAFAARRAAVALDGMAVTVGVVTHPSPANPRANRGWAEQADEALSALGIIR